MSSSKHTWLSGHLSREPDNRQHAIDFAPAGPDVNDHHQQYGINSPGQDFY